MAPRTFRWIVLMPPIVMMAASCAVGPNYVTPSAKVDDQWLGASAGEAKAGRSPSDRWWKAFNDPVLDGLIEAAYHGNLSLQAAGVHILETRAQFNKSLGNLFPQQQGIGAQVDYASLPDKTPDYTSGQTMFAASWELDVWGKYRRGIESDQAIFLGSVASYDDALVTLIADVAGSYINIRTLEERERVAQRNIEAQRESLRIATAQFKAGETTERDVQLAAAQLAQTEAKLPQLEEVLRQTRNGLAVLLGETPQELEKRLQAGGPIPVVPTTVATGIPRDLLRRRPDIRAAGLAAASKSALIGVAKAEMYPTFTLTGQFGASGSTAGASSLSDMFNWQSSATKVGGSFFLPIFNYGRLKNQVRVQDAQFQQAILHYQEAVLKAAKEVEDGLATFTFQQQAAEYLAGAVTAARRSSDLALVEYKGGQVDYTSVLAAEQAQLSTEDALAVARGNVALGVIAVYRALGGGWELREGRDVVSPDVKDEMGKRTDWGKMLEPSGHLPPPETPPSSGQ